MEDGEAAVGDGATLQRLHNASHGSSDEDDQSIAASVVELREAASELPTQDSDDEGEWVRDDTQDARLWALGNAALPVHYFVLGFVNAVVVGVSFGELMGVMAVEAHVYATCLAVLAAPWGCKFLVGFASDRFPLIGYKRRSYAALGWGWAAMCFGLLVALFTEPPSYYCMGENNAYDTGKVCNPDASDVAHVLVAGLTMGVAGVVVAASAADGLMVECAQLQETAKARGGYPVACLIVRVLGSINGSMFLALAFDGPLHLGTFGGDIGIRCVLLVCAGCSAAQSTLWIFCARADRQRPHHVACCGGPAITMWRGGYANSLCRDACTRLADLYRLFCTRGFFRFLVFNLVSPAMLTLTPPIDGPVRRYWAHVGQFQHQASGALTAMLFVVALVVFRCCLLGMNWRVLVGCVTCATTVAHATIGVVTATGMVRNQYFFLVQDPLDAMPLASLYLVATLACVELAPPGQEATIYSLVTTSHNVMLPLSRSASNALYSALPYWVSREAFERGALSVTENYTADTQGFRWIVTISILFSAAVAMASLLLLPMLPTNEISAGRLKFTPRTPTSNTRGVVACSMLVGCFVCGVSLDIMAVLPTASCLPVLGGSGCSVAV